MYTKQIIFFFKIFEAILIAAIFGLFSYTLQNQNLLFQTYEIGLKFGTFSLFALAATLTPGILKRLGLFRSLMIMLTPFKRHMGITSYLLALGHYFLVTLLPSIATNTFPPVITTASFFGFMGFLTLTPLFITSNDFALKKLGRNWGRLHKLVYLAGIFILVHVTLQLDTTTLIAFPILVLEIASYIKLWFFGPKLNPPAQVTNS